MTYLFLALLAIALLFLFLLVRYGRQIKKVRPAQFWIYVVVVLVSGGLAVWLGWDLFAATM